MIGKTELFADDDDYYYDDNDNINKDSFFIHTNMYYLNN